MSCDGWLDLVAGLSIVTWWLVDLVVDLLQVYTSSDPTVTWLGKSATFSGQVTLFKLIEVTKGTGRRCRHEEAMWQASKGTKNNPVLFLRVMRVIHQWYITARVLFWGKKSNTSVIYHQLVIKVGIHIIIHYLLVSGNNNDWCMAIYW
jgi:hypothetical protein